MNILFVYSVDDILLPTKPLQTMGEISFGISYIASLLKKHGHKIRLLVLNKVLLRKNRDIVAEWLKKFYPRLICFTATTTQYPFIRDIAKRIKAHYPDIYLLIGGPHASLSPQDILTDDFDALCIGEGEYPTLELVSQLERDTKPSNIPNLWIRRNSGFEKNLARPFLQNIDNLPFPDREMWREWVDENGGATSRHSVLLARGCPFECSYCCNHAFKKLASGSYVRYRTPDNIVEEITEIVTEAPTAREIILSIETIGTNTEWTMELCSKLERINKMLGRPISFGTNLRITPNANLEDLFAVFKKSNFSFINIGLESGSERIRRDILRRHYSNQDVVKTVSLAKKYGLSVYFFNLIGIPGETMSDFKETVKMNRICLPNGHYNYIFFPYPGTDLYSLCKKEGLINGPLNVEMERRRPTLDLPGFSKKEILKSYIWFDYYAFIGRRPIYKVLGRVFIAWLRTEYYPYFFYRMIARLPLFRWLRNKLKKY